IVVNGISGTPVTVAFACANAVAAASVMTAHVEARIRLIERPLSRAEPIPAPPMVQRSMAFTPLIDASSRQFQGQFMRAARNIQASPNASARGGQSYLLCEWIQ